MDPVNPAASEIKKDSHWITVASLAAYILLSLGVIVFFYFQNQQLKKMLAAKQIQPTPTSTPTPEALPKTTPRSGWQIYKNQQYNFEFSYPDTYKLLTDKEDLYGWPKAILLLYKGGQSYDLAVEIWNTEAEFKTKYPDASILSAFKTKDGKFITLINPNKDPEVAEIISTFKFTGVSGE